MTLGERIMEIRTGRGLSQEQFAEMLGTTRQSVSRWELDQALPSLETIVRVSTLFAVTTDSLLREGISTFDAPAEAFSCGVVRSDRCEAVVTERYALVFSKKSQAVFGTKLYAGLNGRRTLCAVCERDQAAGVTKYAYLTDRGRIMSSDAALQAALGEALDEPELRRMRRLERFRVDHTGTPMPTVSEAGIKKCLLLWRMADSLQATEAHFQFYLCTGRTEYIFSIRPENTDIYCGASYNTPFELGLYGGGQYFRIRSFGDNRAPYCGFFCDFDAQYMPPKIPTEQIRLGGMVKTRDSLLWCVKRYSEEEIVLQGCGGDEYVYRRNDRVCERFLPGGTTCL